MKPAKIRKIYDQSLKRAAKFYHEYHYNLDRYSYFHGSLNAYGRVLGYDFEKIKQDLADAIEQLEEEHQPYPEE